MRHTAYQLSIRSDIPLPELLADGADRAAAADVDIRLGKVAAGGLADGQQLGPFLWADRQSLWLQVPRVARFLVQGGHTILVDPEPGIDEDSLRVFLLGSALGALLFQRGHLVLHGNAVRIGGQCMVCVGQSGAGKSTLAAGLMQRGHDILADDVVAVDAACRALAGFPRIKLWQDMAEQLRIDTASLCRVRPGAEKFSLPVSLAPGPPALQIRWIYILGSDQGPALRLEPVDGLQRFQPLHENTYRVRYLQGMALEPEHLQLCGRLAGGIRLARVTRPKGRFELDALIDLLLADMAAHP
jgi:hypothetical protein